MSGESRPAGQGRGTGARWRGGEPATVTQPGTRPCTSAAGSGRTVLVTGASRGIGAQLAAAFAAGGDRVIGVSRSGQAPDGVEARAADVRDREAMAAVVREAGRVDVLVTAAGVAPQGLAARLGPQAWDEAVAVNLTGSFIAAQAVLPGMLAARSGRIVFVSSVIAARGGVGLAAYAASKGGVEGLTRSLAREVAGRGVCVNAVAPGLIDTAMTRSLPEHVREGYVQQIPAGRMGGPEEVVAPVLFLAGAGATYVTGQVLGVDGGLGMGR